jgi:IS30 family transposase
LAKEVLQSRFSASFSCQLNSLLKEYWSPEQIRGRLELDKKIKISTETAYRFVLQDKAVGGALYKYLRHQHKKYRKRYFCMFHSFFLSD